MVRRGASSCALLLLVLALASGCRALARYASSPQADSGLEVGIGDAARVDLWLDDSRPDDLFDGPRADRDGGGDGSNKVDVGTDATAIPDASADLLPITVETHNGQTFAVGSKQASFGYGSLWDLTRCPLELRVTIDLSQLTTATNPDKIFVEVGLRQAGKPTISPSGFGGWLTAIPAEIVPTNPLAQDIDDKLMLQAKAGEDEKSYDVDPLGKLVAPFGTFNNHGIWFDRDGNSVATQTCAGVPSGVSFCSGGIYNVVIIYRAVGAKGTMVATVNGMEQGFNTGGWKRVPDIAPAGKSFSGDLTQLQLFLGLLSAEPIAGPISAKGIKLTGCKAL